MFYKDYCFSEEIVLEYVRCVIETPLSFFIRHIRENLAVRFLEYKDFIQFSSLLDATINICRVIEAEGDNGLTYVDLGQLLLDDGVERNVAAYRKYGENHTKTAQEFGLTQVLFAKTYLTCIGRVITKLSEYDQQRLLRRMILRNRYFLLIVKISCNECITLDSQMGLLAESTKKRRLSNIRKVWSFILEEDNETESCLTGVIP